MTTVLTLTETFKDLGTTALGGVLTLAGVFVTQHFQLRRSRAQRSQEKAEDTLRAVDGLELVGPVPGLLSGGEGPHAGSETLPDLMAARAAVAAVRNSALLIDGREVRDRVGAAVDYLGLCTFPGMFKTLPVDSVWPDACGDIRECVAAYARGDKLPDPPPMYEHYDRALRPMHESMKRIGELARDYVERLERGGKESL